MIRRLRSNIVWSVYPPLKQQTVCTCDNLKYADLGAFPKLSGAEIHGI